MPPTRQKDIISPRGVAVFPKLNEPDRKFDADGTYSVDLALEGEAAAEFQTMLEETFQAGYAEECEKLKKPKLKIGSMPWKPETDKDGNETGRTLFRFKLSHTARPKDKQAYTRSPKLFFANGTPCADRIGGGSVIQVAFSPGVYYKNPTIGCGLTCRMSAVLVHELKKGGRNTAEDFGFETTPDPEDAASSPAGPDKADY